MDWEVKDEVKSALLEMLEALKQKYVSVLVATWDRNLGKGFDDVLLKLSRQEISGENVFNFLKAEEFLTQFLGKANDELDYGVESEITPIDEEQEIEDDYDDFAPENMGLSDESTL